MKKLSDPEVQEALRTLPGWTGDGTAIVCTYTLPTYEAGVGFAVQVALIAQRTDHHPDLTIGWKTVTVRYTTHDAGGVTQRDVEAARTVAAVAPR